MQNLNNRFAKSIWLFATFSYDSKASCLWIWQKHHRILKLFESLKSMLKIKDKSKQDDKSKLGKYTALSSRNAPYSDADLG